jgi:regulatory protein
MKILKFQKNKIYLQNDEIIDINRDIKAKYRIKTDGEISKDEYRDIIYDSALSKSYFLLSKRDYTVRELLQKLRMKYKRSSIVEGELQKIVYKLSDLGYLDDYTYARSYIDRKKSLGRKRIEYELHLKGIDSSTIDDIYGKEEVDEKKMISDLLHKVKNKEKDKQVAYFMRRGFKLGDILDVLKGLD